MAVIANRTSSQTQIAQSTLSESAQAVKVTVVDGSGGAGDLATEATLEEVKVAVEAIEPDVEAIKVSIQAIEPDVDAIRVSNAAILVDTTAIKNSIQAIEPDVEAIRVSALAIESDVDAIKVASEAIAGIVDEVDHGATTNAQRVSAQLGIAGAAVSSSNPVPAKLQDGANNALESLTSAPSGTERGLIVRNIPSGTQTVSAPGVATETTLDAIRGLLRGKNVPHRVRNDYSVTNVLTSAYVELVASTSEEITELDIFDSSGNILVVAFGAASSEVDQFYIYPGGNGKLPVTIAAGTRVSVKSVNANSVVGDLVINFFGS